jgi:GNAT superfamily N-acetyltransferase
MKTEDIHITAYNPLYKDDFVCLNKEWITHFFKLESQDYELFANPEQIVTGGGNIFFALLSGKAIGTVAVLKENELRYEIAKMAVSPEYQGKGIGKLLLKHAIDYAKKNGATSIYLISNTKLTSAVTLYEKLGFQQISGTNAYERGDYMAELFL